MAKNGDIIDFMFQTLIDLVGWIFKIIFKFIWWIISTIFGSLFRAIFGKKKSPSDNQPESSSDTTMYSYQDCVNDYKKAVQEYDGEELKNRYEYLLVNFLVNVNISAEEKCKLIELHDEKIRDFFQNDTINISQSYMNCINTSFTVLKEMFGGQSAMFNQELNKFSNDLTNNNLEPMSQYLGQIMTYAGLAGSPNGEFTMNYKIFNKYKIPNWV